MARGQPEERVCHGGRTSLLLHVGVSRKPLLSLFVEMVETLVGNILV